MFPVDKFNYIDANTNITQDDSYNHLFSTFSGKEEHKPRARADLVKRTFAR